MKKLLPLVTSGALGSGIVSANAADLAPRLYAKAPPPAVSAIYDSSGLYVGVNGGWAVTEKCWNLVGFQGGRFPAIDDGCPNPSGGIVGGQIGYNMQIGQLVLGLEAQGD